MQVDGNSIADTLEQTAWLQMIRNPLVDYLEQTE